MSAMIDRIRKLFALSQKNSNPHEAAEAMRKARAMMHEHGINDADLNVAQGPGVSPILHPDHHWMIVCYRAAALIYGAVVIEDPKGRMIIVGREHIRDAVQVTGEYLVDQVEHWYKTALKTFTLTKSERAVFRRDFKETAAMGLYFRADDMSKSDMIEPSNSRELTIVSEAKQHAQEARNYYEGNHGAVVVRQETLKWKESLGNILGAEAADHIKLKQEVSR